MPEGSSDPQTSSTVEPPVVHPASRGVMALLMPIVALAGLAFLAVALWMLFVLFEDPHAWSFWLRGINAVLGCAAGGIALLVLSAGLGEQAATGEVRTGAERYELIAVACVCWGFSVPVVWTLTGG